MSMALIKWVQVKLTLLFLYHYVFLSSYSIQPTGGVDYRSSQFCLSNPVNNNI